MPAVKAHFRALPYQEVAAALEIVDGSKASKAAKLCLRFLILTVARSGEARGATWVEVDSEAREWRIPGERMKGGAGHRVPLSGAALAVLERVRGVDDGSGLIFPSPLRPGRPLSPVTLTKILRDRGLADRATVHGFRSASGIGARRLGSRARLPRPHWRTPSGESRALTSEVTCWRGGECSWTSGRRSSQRPRTRWSGSMDEPSRAAWQAVDRREPVVPAEHASQLTTTGVRSALSRRPRRD